MLGEMVAIVAMLAQGIKLDGSVILQIRGDGPIRTAMVECTDRTTLRGIVRMIESAAPDFARGAGQLAITLKPHRGQMYQGIVELDDRLGAARGGALFRNVGATSHADLGHRE